MRFPHPASLVVPVATLTPVSLAGLNAKQLAYFLVEPPTQLLIDCGWLLKPHALGMCHFVSQLLRLHQRGTRIWLCKVPPVMRRCLHELGLGATFHLAE